MTTRSYIAPSALALFPNTGLSPRFVEWMNNTWGLPSNMRRSSNTKGTYFSHYGTMECCAPLRRTRLFLITVIFLFLTTNFACAAERSSEYGSYSVSSM